jgi:hypothetical protein
MTSWPVWVFYPLTVLAVLAIAGFAWMLVELPWPISATLLAVEVIVLIGGVVGDRD